jgi:hypothetical protein
VGILNKGGLFNKGVSEAIDKWRERGGSGSAETVLKFNGYGKRKIFFVQKFMMKSPK